MFSDVCRHRTHNNVQLSISAPQELVQIGNTQENSKMYKDVKGYSGLIQYLPALRTLNTL
jgi:hypothetical protein